MTEANCDDLMTVAVAPHQVPTLILMEGRPADTGSTDSRLYHRYMAHGTISLCQVSSKRLGRESSEYSPIRELGMVLALKFVGSPFDVFLIKNLSFSPFRNGMNKVCFTHVDNYAHGLIIAERALHKGSPALGKFYIVTDGDTHTQPEGYGYFWKEIDKAVIDLGFTSIWSKFKLPVCWR